MSKPTCVERTQSEHHPKEGRQIGLCPCGWVWVLPDHAGNCKLCGGEIAAPKAVNGFVIIPHEAYTSLEEEWLNTLDANYYDVFYHEDEE